MVCAENISLKKTSLIRTVLELLTLNIEILFFGSQSIICTGIFSICALLFWKNQWRLSESTMTHKKFFQPSDKCLNIRTMNHISESTTTNRKFFEPSDKCLNDYSWAFAILPHCVLKNGIRNHGIYTFLQASRFSIWAWELLSYFQKWARNWSYPTCKNMFRMTPFDQSQDIEKSIVLENNFWPQKAKAKALEQPRTLELEIKTKLKIWSKHRSFSVFVDSIW